MRKGIPDIISPELLKVLHEMGHGDAAVGLLERFVFYERAKKAYAIVATLEKGAYGSPAIVAIHSLDGVG